MKDQIIKLRQATGAGISDIKEALEEAQGSEDKALELLRKRGIAKAAKKQDRDASEGLVHTYEHAGGRVGAMVEVACETDFVARNEDFKAFVHDVALQVAASSPLYLATEEVPVEILEKEKEIAREQLNGEGKLDGKPEDVVAKILEGKVGKYFEEHVLLEQSSIKEESKKISELVQEITAKVGEKVEIKRFVRFEVGKKSASC